MITIIFNDVIPWALVLITIVIGLAFVFLGFMSLCSDEKFFWVGMGILTIGLVMFFVDVAATASTWQFGIITTNGT